MALTGRRDGPPLGPPAPLVPRLTRIAGALTRATERLGAPLRVDPLELLGERAALSGLHRGGTISCGGATRLLRARDGWLAVGLARAGDVDLLPAWLDGAGREGEPWATVTHAVAPRRTADLVERAALLGLPVAALGERRAPRVAARGRFAGLPVRVARLAGGPPRSSLRGVRVVDLSALWAGPLCGGLLADAGAAVVKVESVRRPDGTRVGAPAFFRLLNERKARVALDFDTAGGRAALHDLLEQADVVIEASRPRALEQLGIDAARQVGAGTTRVWVSITGHGRTGPGRDRVAFGDDAAVAGGLVAWEDGRPRFCADAVADPATGLVAAAACGAALAAGGSWRLDVAMAEVAAHLAGPTLAVPRDVVAAAPPRAPRAASHVGRRDEEDRGRLSRLEQAVHLRP
jgi:hypothetical protein